MSTERVKNTKRNIMAAFSSRVLNLLLPFVVNTIIIYSLGVEYLGLNSLFASVLQVLSLAEMGVGTALVFSMYEPIANKDTEKICALLNLYKRVYRVIGIIILVLGLIGIPFLGYIVKGDVPDGLSIYILFIIELANTTVSYFLFAYRSALLNADQRNDIVDKVSILTYCTGNVIKILILLLVKNYYVFCCVNPIVTIANNVIVWKITMKKYPQYECRGYIEKEELKDIKKRIAGMFLNRICIVSCNSFDSIVISSFLGLTMLGKYNNYFYVMNALAQLIAVIMLCATPSIGNSLVKETKEKNYKDFNMLQFGLSWLINWVVVCLLCLYQPFMKLWVGEGLMFEMYIPVLFCLYLYTLKIGEVFNAYRQAAGIWWQDRIRPVVETVLNIVLNIVLVKIFGIGGVIIATIITMGIVRTIWGSYYLFREYFTEYKHSKYILRIVFYTITVISVAALTLFLCNLINLSGIVEFLVRAVICLIVPNILFVICYCKLPEFKQLLGFVRTMLKR